MKNIKFQELVLGGKSSNAADLGDLQCENVQVCYEAAESKW